ncbi:hypothetical protein [Kribbella sp. NPDC023855]|uniref:hypothetical protein n=1 Tax=Kribbella sp. NPDC023855 TaxID=3154698 RepID=UPI00340BFEC0
MSETEDQSPFGRGFIAAAIIIAATLACGAVLLATGPSSDAGNPAAAQSPGTVDSRSDGTARGDSAPAGTGSTSGASQSGNPGSGDPRSSDPGSGDPGSSDPGSGDPGSSDPGSGDRGSGDPGSGDPGSTEPGGSVGVQPSGARPSQPGSDSGATAGPQSAGASGGGAERCRVRYGDQGVPSGKGPGVDGWEVSRRVVVPRSAAYGPGKTDSDGFRRCFAHSPTGAVYAAYNVIAALADQTKAVATARKLMLPGRETDILIEQLATESGDTSSEPTQLAGYRVVDASRDRVTIMLALPVESQYMSATITLTWYAGDWRLVPPPSGSPVGAPYSQHRDLDGFVAWSGV